jgi:ketosteroid isomerase-like protein
MSQENVEFIRQSIRRFAELDFEGLGEDYRSDAVLHAPEGWPDGAVFEGRDAIVRQFSRLQEDWQRQDMAPARIEGHGDWVIAELLWEAAGAGSGVPTKMTIVGAYRVEARRIAEARFFWNWDEALTAAGLRE